MTWTRHAYGLLDEAMAFIARDQPQTAAIWLERLLDAAANLAGFPDQGRIVPETARADIREILVSPYRLIYHRDANTVTVMAIIHERRLLDENAV